MPLMKAEKKLYPLPTKDDLKDFLFAQVNPARRWGVFVRAYPPAIVHLHVHKFGTHERYRLQLPWTAFIVTLRFGAGINFGFAYMGFSMERPAIKSRVHVPRLPNVANDGWACMGKGHRPWSQASVKRYVDNLFRDFWIRPFTRELGYDECYLTMWAKSTAAGEKMRFPLNMHLASLIERARVRSGLYFTEDP